MKVVLFFGIAALSLLAAVADWVQEVVALQLPTFLLLFPSVLSVMTRVF